MHSEPNGEIQRVPHRRIFTKEQYRKIEELGVAMRIRGFTFKETAQKLREKHGINVRWQTVEKVIYRALGRSPVPNANVLRTMEDLRINGVIKVMSKHLYAKNEPFNNKYRAGTMLHKMSERRSTMFGLNMQPTFMTPAMSGAQQDSEALDVIVRLIKSETDESKTTESNQESQ